MTQLQASTHGSLTDEQATASLGVTTLEPDTDPTRGKAAHASALFMKADVIVVS